MGRIAADPNGAADTQPNDEHAFVSTSPRITGWLGRNGARCDFLWEKEGTNIFKREQNRRKKESHRKREGI